MFITLNLFATAAVTNPKTLSHYVKVAIKKDIKRKGQMKMISEYFDIKMLEHFQKAAAKSNEIDERLKHCPRETKYSTTKFYNFNNKRRGARKV